MKTTYLLYISVTVFMCLVSIAPVLSIDLTDPLPTDREQQSAVCMSKNGTLLDFNEKYAIVIDGGSQGTRIHVYTLSYCEDQIYAVINDTMCRNFLPLSSMARDLGKVKSSINTLLEFAERNVPLSRQATTPIALMATAGLRLTGPEASGKILQTVRNTLANSTFQFLDPEKYVSVISGADEGIWSWIATNFLAERIGYKAHQVKRITGKNVSTTAIVDLGGASLQIAYELTEDDIKKTVCSSSVSLPVGPQGPITPLNFGGVEYSIYQTSFLGYGLIEARKKAWLWFVNHNNDTESMTFPCLPPRENNMMNNSLGRPMPVNGGPDIDAQKCSASLDPIFPLDQVDDKGVYWYTFKDLACAATLKDMDIHAQSFFADILQPFFDDPTCIRLHDIEEKAKTLCSVDYFDDPADNELDNHIMRRKKLSYIYGYAKQNQFMCQDIVYVLHLLKTGFGLTDNSKLTALKFMHNVELGWALGAAMQMIDERTL